MLWSYFYMLQIFVLSNTVEIAIQVRSISYSEMCCKQHFKFPSFTKRITADFKMHIVRMISKNKLTTQKQKLYGGNCFTVKQIFIVQASNKQLSLWCRSEKGDIFNVSPNSQHFFINVINQITFLLCCAIIFLIGHHQMPVQRSALRL